MNSIRAAITYLKARLDERSTYMFFIASLGSVAGLAKPFNWMGCIALIVAAMLPDGTVTK